MLNAATFSSADCTQAQSVLPVGCMEGHGPWATSFECISDSSCTRSTYSYGSNACSPCAASATFISATAGCAPATAPTDTAFYLSGAQDEGVAAFVLTGAAPAFVSDHVGATSGAVMLASGSFLTAHGNAAPATLPRGGDSSFSASAWVHCANSSGTMAVLEWGALGDALGISSPQAIALSVASPALSATAIAGFVSTLAGGGGSQMSYGGSFGDGVATNSGFSGPAGVAVFPSGAVVIADQGNVRIRLVSPTGIVTTLAGSGLGAGGSNGGAFADGMGTNAAFDQPTGVAVIPSTGAIVVCDYGNGRIRLVSPSGSVTTLAGRGNVGSHADGQGTSATFFAPGGVAIFPVSEIIVVADSFNHLVRLVSPQGLVSTLAGSGITDPSNGGGAFADGTGRDASFSWPWGVAIISRTGEIVIADKGNNRLRLIAQDGTVTTIAGSGSASFADGMGSSACFNQPTGVAIIPSSSTIVVADSGNNRVRLSTFGGLVSTLAGDARGGLADGWGESAHFLGLCCVAVIPSTSTIVVADQGNNLIRLIVRAVHRPAALPGRVHGRRRVRSLHLRGEPADAWHVHAQELHGAAHRAAQVHGRHQGARARRQRRRASRHLR